MSLSPPDTHVVRSPDWIPPDPNTELELLGELVDARFRVDSVIGAGAMGHIYQATELPMGRTVALKVVQPVEGPRANLWFQRFSREASALALLDHPHIVTILDSGKTKAGLPYLAMEYIDGDPLIDLIEERGPLPVHHAFQITVQLARALKRAHSQGILHRDVKPANVMILRASEDDVHAKLLDFGILKRLEEEAATRITQTGTMLGSPMYMSPEQIVGEPLQAGTDIYSLGVTLFHMLAGRPPFDGGSSYDVIQHHIRTPVPYITDVAPEVYCPVALERIVHKCMAKQIEDRYETVEALLWDLGRAWQSVGPELYGEVLPSMLFVSDMTSATPLKMTEAPFTEPCGPIEESVVDLVSQDGGKAGLVGLVAFAVSIAIVLAFAVSMAVPPTESPPPMMVRPVPPPPPEQATLAEIEALEQQMVAPADDEPALVEVDPPNGESAARAAPVKEEKKVTQKKRAKRTPSIEGPDKPKRLERLVDRPKPAPPPAERPAYPPEYKANPF